MLTHPDETRLAVEIEEAKIRGDHEAIKTLTQQLIDLQKTFQTPEPPSDDLLVRKYGARRSHLEKEKDLAGQIKLAQQSKNIELERELRQALAVVQSEQSSKGPRFA